MSGHLHILPLGDRALTVEIADEVSAAAACRVRGFAERVMAARLAGVREVVPAFCSLTVHYDPLALRSEAPPLETLRARLEALLSGLEDEAHSPGKEVDVPVCYGGDHGEDLAALARAHDVAPAQLVALHSAPVYFVGMVGFAPGFPYLAGLDPRLVTPRRATPRPRVPGGSVAIGGEHTGIYPSESPGGWHLIGRTPLTLFDLRHSPPSLLQAGDRVRFVPISAEDFERLAAQGRGG